MPRMIVTLPLGRYGSHSHSTSTAWTSAIQLIFAFFIFPPFRAIKNGAADRLPRIPPNLFSSEWFRFRNAVRCVFTSLSERWAQYSNMYCRFLFSYLSGPLFLRMFCRTPHPAEPPNAVTRSRRKYHSGVARIGYSVFKVPGAYKPLYLSNGQRSGGGPLFQQKKYFSLSF